jgi:G-patch domain
MAEEDDECFIPLEDQRVFGAGIKRKRIAFVPSSTLESVTSTPTETASTRSHDRYLSIIQKRRDVPPENIECQSPIITTYAKPTRPLCSICHLPLSASDAATDTENDSNTAKASHESSIAHQVCLTHSHPPSHLDREHVGLKYLSTYGWDPDSRQGLGAKGEGIRVPIKGKIKNDTSGLGVDTGGGGKAQKQKPPLVRLNAKQVRQQEAEGKKRAARLRDTFYCKDLEQYLGPS